MHIDTDCQFGCFVSSSGHCSLDCSYCIVQPVVKHQPSLDAGDIDFLLERLGGKTFLMFSGKGDFFAGYPKKERLLEHVLSRNVEIGLDVNGVMIHEFAELTAEAINKIRFFNLTFHYTQLKRTNALKAWVKNAHTIVERIRPVLGDKPGQFVLDLIMTPSELSVWREALDFYRAHIWESIQQPIMLQRDVLNAGSPASEEMLTLLQAEYGALISHANQENFHSRFADFDFVHCPAGMRYFRVWNDGLVQGCPDVAEISNLGNIKSRQFTPRTGLIQCADTHHCDCSAIEVLGWMEFPESGRKGQNSPPAAAGKTIIPLVAV